jgi:MFS family permease
MLPLLVAGAVAALQPGPPPDRRPPGSLILAARHVLGPGIFVFAERFAIGLFIVPFSLLCHDVRGLDDAMVGRLYAAFLVPFAVMTGLVPRTALGPVVAVVVGVFAYATSLFAAARVDTVPLLSLVLAGGGIGAAMVYAPSLRTAARVVPSQASAAMGALQGLGALGMFLGGASARLLAELLADRPRAEALRAPLDLGAASLVVLLVLGIVPFARAARAADASADEESNPEDDDGRPADGHGHAHGGGHEDKDGDEQRKDAVPGDAVGETRLPGAPEPPGADVAGSIAAPPRG